MIYETK